LKRVLNEQWPAGWLRQVQTFNVRPIAAASIGQVHRAQLKDGRDLAIKVQYPGVARSIDSDVANVGALIRMSGLMPGGFDLAPYLEEARKQLHDETDYFQEGAYLGAFRDLLRGDTRFVLPVLHHDWTTKNILSMSFVGGVPIEQAASEPQETRDAIATALVELVLLELFDFRLMQTDPNFANYRYDPESGRIVLLDFGATRRIDPTVVAQYRDLMRAGLDRDREAMEQVSMQIGFFTSDTHARHRNRILEMMELAFSALLEDDIFDFARTDMPRKMQQEGIKLAQDGFVPPPLPIDVLFLQRKFGGVFLLAAKLGARIGVKDLLLRYL
jgi:predicted unusual protein kinase regulating ubiquinone biosynthesis (AarF/ABC1/UbiB family)